MKPDNYKNITHNLQTLNIYLYYRLTLAVVLYGMFITDLADNILGTHHPELFHWTGLIYNTICFGSLIFFRAENLIHSLRRITLLLTIDLIALTFMIHASGGVSSGLGYLLLITAAISSMFIRGQLALAFAAAITLFIIGETIYLTKSTPEELTKDLFTAGILGLLAFVTAITFLYLTNRIRISSEAAEFQSQYAERLKNLAQHIVKRMRTGIAVINEKNQIELINESAMQLLDLSPTHEYVGEDLTEKANLKDVINTWRLSPAIGIPQIHELRSGQEVRINFAHFDADDDSRIILYIEDYRSIIQQAQQLKLASLGRLTASIAHEIRNPLGAMSHASQLLSESGQISDMDKRFSEIILHNCNRIDQIVENTSILSRRKAPSPESIDLKIWLPEFIDEYNQRNHCVVDIEFSKVLKRAKFDPANLRQVLTNLIDNGIRYSRMSTGKDTIEILAGTSSNDDTTFIDVIDDGTGITEDKQSQIFEPFYTTDKEGSGLGLYICKELCEINQASLYYKKTETGKSRFRINFSHHQRMI